MSTQQRDHSLILYKQGSRMTVSSKYDSDSDLWIVMDHYGSNRLISFLEWRLAPNQESAPHPDFGRESQLLQGEGSDWIGPYIVEAASRPGAERKTFTGGNHAYDGNTGGTATARTVQWEVSAGEAAVLERTPIRCNTVTLRVVNEVQATNTREEDGSGMAVLRETVTYSFEAGKVHIYNRIDLLEDVNIYSYYGLQTVNGLWNGTVQYGDVSGFGQVHPVRMNSDSGAKSVRGTIDRFRVRSSDGIHTLTARLDRITGLGRLNRVQDDMPVAFSMAYGKSYFNLIRGNPEPFSKGETISWSGSYKFYREY